jgi:hypothetical protein
MINEHYSMTRVEYQTDVELHFAAIPTDSKIDVSTIHQILGVGAQSCETIDEAPTQNKGGQGGRPKRPERGNRGILTPPSYIRKNTDLAAAASRGYKFKTPLSTAREEMRKWFLLPVCIRYSTICC